IHPAVLNNPDPKLFQHPLGKLQFLVGRKGKNEVGLLGGAWDPQDGGHPDQDPAALIATAKRCFKETTGVDLSQCSSWTKFAQMTYMQPGPEKHSPGFEETTVIYLVDAWKVATQDAAVGDAIAKAKAAVSAEERAQHELAAAEDSLTEAEQEVKEMGSRSAPEEAKPEDAIQADKLTIAQLQEELGKRNLATQWNPLKGKKVLVERLQEFLDARKEERTAALVGHQALQDMRGAVEAAQKRVAAARGTLKAAQDTSRKAASAAEDPPAQDAINVKVASQEGVDRKSRFEVLGMSLRGLLDYTEDDTAAATFEASMFGELFLEMLQARFGRAILRTLPSISQQIAEGKDAEAAQAKSRDRADSSKDDLKGGKGLEKTSSAGMANGTSEKDSKRVSTRSQTKKRAADLPVEPAAGKRARSMPTEGVASDQDSFLLACRFFDRDGAGWLEAEDLEEIAYMVSNNVSRRRVQGLVDSVTKRGKLSYLDFASIPVPPAEPTFIKREALDPTASTLPPLPSSSDGGIEASADGPQTKPARQKHAEGFVSEDGSVVFQGRKINILELQAELANHGSTRQESDESMELMRKQLLEQQSQVQRLQDEKQEAVRQLVEGTADLELMQARDKTLVNQANKGLESMKGIESSAESLGSQLGELRAVLDKLLATSAKQ
ncbi:hypothetical protein WJX84_005175, partial [Apatococcus fuscideae]